MDMIDSRILNILRDDARATFQELGNAVGLTAPAVYQRVKKLEDVGVITGYHAAVDAAALGRPVTALIQVVPPAGIGADNPSWRAAPAFVAGFQLVDGEVVFLGRFTGLDDLAAHVRALRDAGCQVRTQIAQSTAFVRGNPLGA